MFPNDSCSFFVTGAEASGGRLRDTPANGEGLRHAYQLVDLSDDELGQIDPLQMNLLVATTIPRLRTLNIASYQETANRWALQVQARLPSAELVFWQSPHEWKNDVNFFRLGVLCGFLDVEVGIRYRQDKSAYYANPSDLFLNGVMDTKRGTCGNMSALHVAIGWRLGWSVSLASVWSHLICRYDDGKVTHNIEATQTGDGGYSSRSDARYIEEFGIPVQAIEQGSDLRALKPREMLGIFFAMRGRHYQDTRQATAAAEDYRLAHSLFPSSIYLKHCVDRMKYAPPRVLTQYSGLYWTAGMEPDREPLVIPLNKEAYDYVQR